MAGDASWGLRRTVRLAFPDAARLANEPSHRDRLRVYLGDMLSPYGLRLDDDAIDNSRGQAYGDMAEAVIARAVAPGETVDLLVLAYAIPDISPGRATAVYLSDVCPGTPLSFAICDQDTAGAFTGLRLIGEYARSGSRRTALLIVVEQAELPYDPGVPVLIPAGHTAVGLLFGDGAATSADGPHEDQYPAVRVRAGIGTASLAPGFATAFASAVNGPHTGGADPAHGAGVTLIRGSGLATVAVPGGVVPDGALRERTAASGRPFTGAWWEFAGAVAESPAPGLAVVADYAAALGYLCTAAFAVTDPAAIVSETAVVTLSAAGQLVPGQPGLLETVG